MGFSWGLCSVPQTGLEETRRRDCVKGPRVEGGLPQAEDGARGAEAQPEAPLLARLAGFGFGVGSRRSLGVVREGFFVGEVGGVGRRWRWVGEGGEVGGSGGRRQLGDLSG